MTPMPSAHALVVVGAVTRQLNSGHRPDEVLAAVVETLRGQLDAEAVELWVHEPNSTTFCRIAAPPDAATVASLDELPPAAPGADRIRLMHDGECVGILEVRRASAATAVDGAGALLRIVADLLAIFVGSIELSEDLAFEVAVQSREIEEQRLFTSLIIDSLPVGLYVIDREYRIQMWNRKRETGTQGLRRHDVVGRPVFEVLTRQDPRQLKAEFDRVFDTGATEQAELEVPLPGGTRFFRSTRLPMRLDGDAISHVITIGEDVTEARAIQGQVLQSEKLAAIGQLAAGVMHEINNPLATIGACVAAIEGRLEDGDDSVSAQVREYLEIIDKEVLRCTRIVDGLLDFSRPQGRTKRAVAVNGIVEDTLFLLKHHQRFRQFEVRTELEPDLPPATANADQMIQVLMALLLNSIDAMPRGGVLRLRTTRGRSPAGEVVVEVEDDGIGIPREQQSKIFEPFFTTKPMGRGTGLGLSICYGIVEDHRGRIEVESQPGRGSTFRVYLPVEKLSANS
jgi:two-component system NtrC family sensor kinase